MFFLFLDITVIDFVMLRLFHSWDMSHLVIGSNLFICCGFSLLVLY